MKKRKLLLIFILFSAFGFSQQQVLTKTGKLTSLTKVDVDLGNVDNTSDANKPVSTATQTALNEKASLGGDLAGTGSTAAAPVITAGAISTGKLQDNAVTNAKIAVGAGGIYKGSGSLSGPTVVTQGDNTLTFSATAGTSVFIDGSTNTVGIGTTTPQASAVLDITSTSKGFLPPRMTSAQMNAIMAPATGLIVVCTNCSPSGVYFYNGTSWSVLGTTTTTVESNCDAGGFVGNFIAGTSLTGASFSVTITNNSFSTVSIPFTAADLVLSGVSGLTVGTPTGVPALTSGTSTLAAGASVKVTYPLTGTPVSSGSLTGTWTKVALNCSKIKTVLPAASIASLNCAGATNNGSLTAYTQASGVSSILPYTGGNGGGYATQTISSTGVTGLTATLEAGTLGIGTGNLTYTITGTPSGMGTASFVINLGGQECSLTRSVVLPAASIASLNCAGATNNGSLTAYTQASEVSSILPYTGGNGGSYATQTISSTGVTGLTATLEAGALGIGTGNLTYTISGIPSGAGTASFAINLGGQECSLTRSVVLPAASIASLDCAGATNNGTLTAYTQASEVSSILPYTGGNGGSYATQTISSTGVTGLTATLEAGALGIGAGNLTYTITGTPSGMGTASFVINLGGQECSLTRSVVLPAASIASLNCAGATNNGSLYSNTQASGVSSILPYTGGNGGSYATQTISSTGVTGLTATLEAGALGIGAGNLTYTITGTPSGTETASFAINLGGQECSLTRSVVLPAASIASLDCAGATNNGTLTAYTQASEVSSILPYTGGNGGSYATQTISSTGVTGLTATLEAGALGIGAGNLTYTITGTPSGMGTASFVINLGGQECSLTRSVVLPAASIPSLNCAGATNNGSLYSNTQASGVSSILPYTGGNGGSYATQTISSTGVTGLTATLEAGALGIGAGNLTYTITGTPSGTGTASFAINLGGQECLLTQSVVLPASIASLDCAGATNNGTLPPDTQASGVSSTLPYTGGNGGSYATQTISSVGVTGLTATLEAGTLAIGTGNLTYTISGIPSGAGTASFVIDLGGQSCTLTRLVGIYDRAYGLTINGVNNHNFVYGTVTGADNKTWLNNNLGAHYANVNHASFNFTKQATSATDYLAYGSLFQWGRAADGHELITWTSSTTGAVVNGTTSTRPEADTAADNLFITINTLNYDWRGTTQNNALWQGVSGINNPCPVGYRLPTNAELSNLITLSKITDSATAASSAMKFTTTGSRRYIDGAFESVGSEGKYWSSSVSGFYVTRRHFFNYVTGIGNERRAYGFSVRCLKE